MIRRLSAVLTACLLAALTCSAPAYASSGNGHGGGTQVHTDGNLYCC